MNKAQLIESVAIKAGVSKKEADDVLKAFEDLVMENLKNGSEITLTGFGTFSAKKRSSRRGVNPQKPSEIITIPKVTVPKFKAGKTLKDFLKK
ncbi:MAG: HU family DNA-binding protein [Patescibacteria group bacterium]|jgi:DNA-binding protein HU-beta